MFGTKLFVVLACAVMGFAGCAFGGTIILTNVDRARGGNVAFLEDGAAVTGYAGVILATYNGVSVSPLFCVDLFTDISLGTYSSTPVLPRVARHEDRVAWLYVNRVSTVVNANLGRAFQLAVWDIVHDNGDGLSAGRVQASGSTPVAVRTEWQNYLDASVGQSLRSGLSIYVNSNQVNGLPAQNLIGAFAPDTQIDNPEPETWLLIGAGWCGISLSRKRRG